MQNKLNCSTTPHIESKSNMQDGSCLPANLICQLFRSVVRLIRGIFTGHVAGGKEVANKFLWILRAIGVVPYYPTNILQYLAIYIMKKERQALLQPAQQLHC